MTVDTLKFAREMEAVGMPRAQSETLARLMRDEVVAELVTKADLATAVSKLESAIKIEGQRLDAKIDSRTQSLDAKIDGWTQRLEAKIGSESQRLEAKIDSWTQSLEAKIGGESQRLEGKIDGETSKLRAELRTELTSIREQMSHMETRFERMLLRHSLSLVIAMIAVVGLMMRFVR